LQIRRKNQQQKCLIFQMLQMELGEWLLVAIASGNLTKKWFDFKI
jgi:hypothetical protein